METTETTTETESTQAPKLTISDAIAKTGLGEATEASAGFHIENVLEFLGRTPPPVNPIVDGCFEAGDKIDLAAPSKMRKSFWAIDLCLHIAAGRDFLGLKIPQKRKVAYVNLEIKEAWMWRRLTSRMHGYGIEPADIADTLFIVNARGKGAEVREKLESILLNQEKSFDFVCLDPRYKLQKMGEDENSGEGLAGILNMLDKIAETGAAVMVVAHDKKGDSSAQDIRDRGAGSSWAARDVDCRFTLTPHKEDNDNMAVLGIMARNYPPHPALTIIAKPDRWEADATIPPVTNSNKHKSTSERQAEAQAMYNRARDKSVEILCAEGQMTATAFKDKLKAKLNMSVNAAQTMLTRMLDNHDIYSTWEKKKGGRKVICTAGQYKEITGEEPPFVKETVDVIDAMVGDKLISGHTVAL